MSRLPLRIAILECDTPFPKTKEKYGGFGGVFTSLMETAVTENCHPLSEKLSPKDLDIKIFHVVENETNYPNLDDFDGVLITGSKHNSFDDEPWILRLVDFVKEVLAQKRVRLVGICFGHQITARALGAKVGRSPKGWELSVTDVKLTEAGKKLFEQDQLVCSPTVSSLFEATTNIAPSPCSKCTKTKSTKHRQESTSGATPRCVKSTACGRRVSSSPCKATQNTTAISSAKCWTRDWRPAFSHKSSMMRPSREFMLPMMVSLLGQRS